MGTPTQPPGGGESGKPPGVFKVRSYENADQAKAKIEDLVSRGKEFVVSIVTYREKA